ncbi:hypothetical protein HGM15179_009267 [Zosterops borbonicus]|uniref:Ig-like domain-containing protein n=1 Tax=Zosterops borbonicus TaxID=364589 RepID=A0A8K1GFG0_9PASS|nr:hypothetical protein HGM15179_009267 [Zosterops borbonicus]
MNVSMTCLFTDNQKVGSDEINIKWRRQGAEQIHTGITMVWDEDEQKGNTTLQLSNVTITDSDVYRCVVWIRESFDYGSFKLKVLPWDTGKISEETVAVNVTPVSTQVDMWDGPPLRINCTFKLEKKCYQDIQVKWWKQNKHQQWERQLGNISWWTLGTYGKGWLNYTDPKIGETEGIYLCIVSCGGKGNFGLRKVEARAHLGSEIKAQHGEYQVTKGKDVIFTCEVKEGQHFSEYGWWFGKNLTSGGKYQIERRLGESIILIVRNVQPGKDEGIYWCWIAQDDWWAHARTMMYLDEMRVTRQVDNEVGLPRNSKQENLVVGLIRDFGKTQNVSSITACLPLPHAAGDPIPWGIIPITEMPPITRNGTKECRKELHNRTEWTVKTTTLRKQWSSPGSRGDCEALPNSKFITIGRFKNVGWCEYDEVQSHKMPTTKYYYEVVCQDGKEEWTTWQAIWGPSLLETYSYLGKIGWCIQWTGRKNQTHAHVLTAETSHRKMTEKVESWNCTRVITCDTPGEQVGLVPVKILLKWGCECRGYNHSIKGELKGQKQVNCKTTTIRSPGNLVWVMGHGMWTTHIPIDGLVTQITLGVPTLCPFWKQSRLTDLDIGRRNKREVMEGINPEDEWHEPSGGVKLGWMLESLFAPISTYRNREMLYRLLGQTERLASATKKGFKDLNLQLQATSRMAIQNRMALDMLLLKEHGVCGYLHDRTDHCCIHIPNVTKEVEKDISQLDDIESKIQETKEDAEHNWIGAIFSSLGIQVSGWISSVIQYVIMIIILVVIIFVAYRCFLGMIFRERMHTRRVMKAMTRNEVMTRITPPPSYIETAA